jgi:hypothetical protein
MLCSLLRVQDFADMAEAHEWTLRRLREMAGRLTEQAYLRASEAAGGDAEAQARWMLVFDRMARGLRLSIALEAKLHRERRWDADEIEREASGERHEPRWRRGAPSPADAEPCESDRECDDDGLACDAPLSQRIGRLKAIIEGAGSPEPQPRPGRTERQALEAQRAERARRAATSYAPDEPWDIIDPAERAEAGDVPWRSSG